VAKVGTMKRWPVKNGTVRDHTLRKKVYMAFESFAVRATEGTDSFPMADSENRFQKGRGGHRKKKTTDKTDAG